MTAVACILKSRRFPVEADDAEDGGSQNVFRVVEALLARGTRVVAFVRREPEQPPVTHRGALTVIRVDYRPSTETNPLRRDFDEGRSFVDAVLTHPAFQPDNFAFIHTHHWTSGIGLPMALGASVRLVHTPHLLAAEKASHLGLPCSFEVLNSEAELVRRANAVIALSVAEAASLLATYELSPAKIVVIPNGVADWFYSVPIRHANTAQLNLVTIGRICRQKGIDVLLDAMDLLDEENFETNLTIIGTTYGESDFDSNVYRRVANPRLHCRITLAGGMANRQIGEVLGGASVYVQPSRYESQGIALLEAMAAGRAVVASDLPAVREYVEDDINGVLVPVGDAPALARAVCALHGDSSRQLALGHAARQTARRFSWPTAIAKTLAVLSAR